MTNIVGVESFSGPSGQKTEIEVTALADTAAVNLSGLPDYGSLTRLCFDDPADAGNARLLTRFGASNVYDDFKIILPFSGSGNTLTFNAFVKTWQMDAQKASGGKFSSELRLTGAVTRA